MANADWLMTLLSGVGGAFTGASVANERRSREAELARQAARQAQLDERQGENDRRAQFSQGLVDLARANELGYTEQVPRTGPVMASLPGMAGGINVGGVYDAARRGPELAMPDGRKLTLDRMNTPQMRQERAVNISREAAREELLARAQEAEKQRKNAMDIARIRNAPAPSPAPAPGGQTDPLGSLSPAQRTIFVEKQRKVAEMKAAIKQYRDLLDAVGVTIMPSAAQAQLVAAYTNLQMKAKNAAELGALSGPDLGLIENWITPPNSGQAMMRQLWSKGKGKEQLRAQLDTYEQSIDNDTDTLYGTYGVEKPVAQAPTSGADFVAAARNSLRMGGR